MRSEVRELIEFLYMTGKYRDLNEERCRQYFDSERAEAYAVRDRIAAIPGGEWNDWDPEDEFLRSRLMEMSCPSIERLSRYYKLPKAERVPIIRQEYDGKYCRILRLHMSNVAPFYKWSWGCDKLVKVGRDYEIEFKSYVKPPTSFCEGVICAIDEIMAEFHKTRLTWEEGQEIVPWLDATDTELEDIHKPATVYDCFFNPW